MKVERSGETQIAAELREIAKETECGQRQMHLEIAAQIVEQGQFLHPDNFGLAIENDELRSQLAEAVGLLGAARHLLPADVTIRAMIKDFLAKHHLASDSRVG